MKFLLILSSLLAMTLQAWSANPTQHCSENPKIIPVKWGYRMPFPSGGYMHVMMMPVMDRCNLDKKREFVTIEQLKCASEDERDNDSLKPMIEGAKQLLTKVIRAGLPSFAGIELQQVLQKMGALKFRVFQGGFLLGSGGKRFTAVNLLSENMIILNDLPASLMAYNFWEPGLEKYRPIVILHETLGALGFDDENYEASLALWWMAQSRRGDVKEFALAFTNRFGNIATFKCDRVWNQGRNLYNLIFGIEKANAGGASVVGGGGDLHEAMFKAKLLEASQLKFGYDPSFRRELRILNLIVVSSQSGPYGYNAQLNTLTIPTRWKLERLENHEVLNLQRFDTSTWINRYIQLIL